MSEILPIDRLDAVTFSRLGIMGFLFPCYQNGVAQLRGFGGQKIQSRRGLKIFMGRFFPTFGVTNV